MGSHSSDLTNGNSAAQGASIMIRTRICSAAPAPAPPLLIRDHSQRRAAHLQCAPGTSHIDCRSGPRAIQKEDSFMKNGGPPRLQNRVLIWSFLICLAYSGLKKRQREGFWISNIVLVHKSLPLLNEGSSLNPVLNVSFHLSHQLCHS